MSATLAPRLARLYRRTDYVIDGRVHVAIGRRSARADALLRCLGARRAALVTAANPRSRAMTDGWNTRMTRRLAASLARLPTLPAEGRLGTWREHGLLVACDPRRAARLGRRYRQNAIVVLEQGRAARLVLTAG